MNQPVIAPARAQLFAVWAGMMGSITVFTLLVWILRDDFSGSQPNDFIRNMLAGLAAVSILGAFAVHHLFAGRFQAGRERLKMPLSPGGQIPSELIALAVPVLMGRWFLIELGGFLGLVNFMMTGVFEHTLAFVGASILAMLASAPTDSLLRKVLNI